MPPRESNNNICLCCTYQTNSCYCIMFSTYNLIPVLANYILLANERKRYQNLGEEWFIPTQDCLSPHPSPLLAASQGWPQGFARGQTGCWSVFLFILDKMLWESQTNCTFATASITWNMLPTSQIKHEKLRTKHSFGPSPCLHRGRYRMDFGYVLFHKNLQAWAPCNSSHRTKLCMFRN